MEKKLTSLLGYDVSSQARPRRRVDDSGAYPNSTRINFDNELTLLATLSPTEV